jgi:ribonuclease VapC
MIVVDTSAIMAVLMAEPEADRCMAAIESSRAILISAGTVVECGVVAARREIVEAMERFLTGLDMEIVPVTEHSARRAVEAYRLYRKGAHPARLNFGDCFAYELARSRGCPLLFVGNDFALTDVTAA